LAADKSVDLGIITAEPALVSGDEECLQILLRNLLDNAVRYTPAGGRVDVSVLADGDAVRLMVGDDGSGIPEAERTRVFDRFYRGLGTAEPGSGLGLAIVRRIADRHGAAIRLADAEAGRGLKVTVRFPVKPA
jgi:signal transduction histidine kinase